MFFCKSCGIQLLSMHLSIHKEVKKVPVHYWVCSELKHHKSTCLYRKTSGVEAIPTIVKPFPTHLFHYDKLDKFVENWIAEVNQDQHKLKHKLGINTTNDLRFYCVVYFKDVFNHAPLKKRTEPYLKQITDMNYYKKYLDDDNFQCYIKGLEHVVLHQFTDYDNATNGEPTYSLNTVVIVDISASMNTSSWIPFLRQRKVVNRHGEILAVNFL